MFYFCDGIPNTNLVFAVQESNRRSLMNKHAKGARVEGLAKKKAEALGYIVERKNWNRFASKDFYGCFDLMCVHKDTGHILFVQVKSNQTDVSRARKKIKEWELLKFFDCQIWLYIGRREWSIITIENS